MSGSRKALAERVSQNLFDSVSQICRCAEIFTIAMQMAGLTITVSAIAMLFVLNSYCYCNVLSDHRNIL